MNEGDNAGSTVIYSLNISSGTSNSMAKYGGLIHRSLYKRSRCMMIQLFNYIYNATPYLKLLHYFIMIFRILQLIGPCLVESSQYWLGSDGAGAVDVISVFYHIIPPSERNNSVDFFIFAYFVVSVVFALIIIGSAIYFEKNAKLPILISYIIVVYFATFQMVIHPVALHLGFEYLSRSLFKSFESIGLVRTIIIPLLVLIAFGFFSWIYMMIVTQTLTFRPSSLMMTLIFPQNIFYLLVNLINAITGFLVHCPRYAEVALLFVTAFIYVGVAYIPFFQGGFISEMHGAVVCAGSIAGAVVCISIAVDLIFGFGIGLPILFAIILLVTLLIFVMRIVMTRRIIRHLLILDKFADGHVDQLMSSVNNVLNVVIDGMKHAHPSCVSWDVFKDSLQQFPRDVRCWYIFAKFSSIYPEDITTLSWIFHSVVASKLRGAVSRTIKEQCLSISRQRESNLSPSLKLKINTVNKEVASSKHKLRHIWDLAIQGNTGDMESAVKRYYKDMEKADSEFKHLFRQYPNNRFVTRAYARFCKELKANMNEFSEYMDKSRSLQRGYIVNEDLTHRLGLLAFPNLPVKSTVNCESSAGNDINVSSSIEINEDDDQNLQDEVINNTLSDTIQKLSIPSIHCVKITRVLMLVVIFVFPIVALFITSSAFIEELVVPLAIIADVSTLSTLAMQMVMLNNQFFFENMNHTYGKVIAQDRLPGTFGYTYDTREMLTFIIAKTTMASQDIFEFRKYTSSNKNIKEAQSLLFSNTFKYKYINSPDNINIVVQTIQTSINQEITEITSMLREPVMKEEFVNSSYILNPIGSNWDINLVFDVVLTLFVEFFKDNNTSTVFITNILMIAGIIFVILAFMISLVIQLLWIQSNKEEAYRCLTLLPKNTVSSLVENLRVLKNDDNESTSNTDTEVNKQEDNIMKILVTGGDSSENRLGDRIILIVGSIVITICEVASIYLFINLYQYESMRLIYSAPHLNYIPSVYIQAAAGHLILRMLSLRYENNDLQVRINPTEIWETRFLKRIEMLRMYYHKARFGGGTPEEVPFAGFSEGVEKADSVINCPDPTIAFENFLEMAGCYNIEGVFVIFDYMLTTLYYNYKSGGPTLKSTDVNFDYMFTLLISPLYNDLFGPMFETIIPTIQEELEAKKTQDYPILITLLFVGIIIEVIAFVQVLTIEKHIRSVLMLLLHCPQSIVMSTSKIMTVLQGNFSRSKGDLGKRNAEFYDSIFRLLPDSVVICDQLNYQVTCASKSCERIFQMPESEIIGKDIKEILSSAHFIGYCSEALKEKSETKISCKDNDGSIMSLVVSSMKISNQLAVIIRDVTGTVRYNKLIQDERAKSDALLAAILPPSLVHRVQAGEKNISFAVQTATIVFMDIVSFTPWCGSNEATKVMMTLNLLFKKLDCSLSKYSTMTKIKCIGDCYMAAGGIFSEINNPAEHAKEVVNFGLDALDCVTQLDAELDEKLRIRVGINTGGPIVAGVLGIGKPTFEILGPAINMAQQMEHHGIAMKVQISRSVYEFIYGESFNIKERGKVEVKNGSVITYLIDRKESK